MFFNNKFIIFSVEKSDETKGNNKVNSEYIVSYLKAHNIPFIKAWGVYKNIRERSIVVPLTFKNIILNLAVNFEQESILVQNNDQCGLFNPNDQTMIVQLSILKEVSRYDAYNHDSYTIVKNKYYVAS
jgi:hypothetical protein